MPLLLLVVVLVLVLVLVLLTLLRLLMIRLRLGLVLMLAPSRIHSMHRELWLMKGLRMRHSHFTTSSNLLRVSEERHRGVYGSHDLLLLLSGWFAIARHKDLTQPTLFD
jgi:hypothetical protein